VGRYSKINKLKIATLVLAIIAVLTTTLTSCTQTVNVPITQQPDKPGRFDDLTIKEEATVEPTPELIVSDLKTTRLADKVLISGTIQQSAPFIKGYWFDYMTMIFRAKDGSSVSFRVCTEPPGFNQASYPVLGYLKEPTYFALELPETFKLENLTWQGYGFESLEDFYQTTEIVSIIATCTEPYYQVEVDFSSADQDTLISLILLPHLASNLV
jgi:hypothetical protein